MKKTRIFILLLFLTGNSYAQYNAKQIDSLLSLSMHYSDINDRMDLKKSLVLAKKAYDYSKKINYKEGISNSVFVITVLNFNMGNDQEVIAYSRIGKDLIDKSNNFKLIENLRVRAMSLTNLGFMKESRQELREALLLVKKITHPDDREFTRANIYTAYSFSFETEVDDHQAVDSLMFYSRKAYNGFEKIKPGYRGLENNIALASINLGSSCLQYEKKLDSVEFYLTRALSLSKKNGYVFVECLANQHLGNMYFARKEYQKSISFYKEALFLAKSVNDPSVTAGLYKNISKSYEALKDDANTKDYLSRYIKLNDSITTARKKAVKLPMEQIIQEKEKKFSDSRSWYISIIAISCLLLALFIYLSYLFFRKFRTEKMSKLEKEQLLEEKKKEIERNNDSADEKLNEIIRLAINDNPVFYIRFQEFYTDFCNTLKAKAPSLTLSELKCCALLKLNFSTKEIARFTNSTVRAVEQKKYRLRKKLSIPSDEDINLWMMNL